MDRLKSILNHFTAWPNTLLRFAKELWRELWVRVVVMGLVAIVALLLAQAIGHFLPEKMNGYISGKAADRLLSIIANAMLAVTTFSLTVMVTVYRSSSSQFTPRLHRLIIQDPTTQNTLAAFIGAYVYALVAIILRELGVFADERAAVLFITTVLVLAYVVVSMIRWVLHLQTFGSLMDTTRQIEGITLKQFEARLAKPCLGANPWTDDVSLPDGAEAVRASETGYIQQYYEESLNEAAHENNADVYLSAAVGKFVMKGEKIAYWVGRDGGPDDEKDMGEIVHSHIQIGDMRTYDQDPRFGLMVLGEIASKALSPGINDPGTAIDVITRVARILYGYKDETEVTDEPEHPHLWVRPLDPKDLIEDGYGALARDGAALIEVQQRLQSALSRLMQHDSAEMAEAAHIAAVLEFRRAKAALLFEPDIDRLRSSTARTVLKEVDGETAQ
ncbi:DUF2254 domain-containing protein [Litoreibacter arenae]|uniref:DUF2254 domain-containing protein n=1 Tax=Litoreibacter arenae DSM 19593 TaxID=1123360 RepID=S9QH25_9RHOB|nr:DUF2254 domain-containing protein [Litoreibacter arenae]EPX78908.1 hypothetical protein thalar_01723 [Litoreibacter arenae DSM 19593]